MKIRSLIQRTALFLGIVLLSVYLYHAGKGHTLLIDTRAITVDGVEFSAPDSIAVSVNGSDEEFMGRAERLMVDVMGPRHRIRIEDLSGGIGIVEAVFEIPTRMRTAIVSVSAILGSTPKVLWVAEFVPPPREAAAAEQMQFQEPDAPPGATSSTP